MSYQIDILSGILVFVSIITTVILTLSINSRKESRNTQDRLKTLELNMEIHKNCGLKDLIEDVGQISTEQVKLQSQFDYFSKSHGEVINKLMTAVSTYEHIGKKVERLIVALEHQGIIKERD